MTVSLFPENSKYELTHPVTGEPTGLIIEILPPDHDDVYQAKVDIVKKMKTSDFSSSIEASLDLTNRINIAIASIAGWEVTSDMWTETFKKLGYDNTDYTAEKCSRLLSMKTAGWIRQQVDNVVTDKERFFNQASLS
jgi:hypothetical protein